MRKSRFISSLAGVTGVVLALFWTTALADEATGKVVWVDARNSALLLPVHRFQGPAKILPSASLDLHENKGVALAADEIDLAALASAEVAVKDLETVTA